MKMDRVYEARFPGYYICLDEQAAVDIDYKTFASHGFPIKIMYPDYIVAKEVNGKSRGFSLQAGTDCYLREKAEESILQKLSLSQLTQSGKLLPLEKFESKELLMFQYNTNITIWEQIILRGLLEGRIGIDDH